MCARVEQLHQLVYQLGSKESLLHFEARPPASRLQLLLELGVGPRRSTTRRVRRALKSLHGSSCSRSCGTSPTGLRCYGSTW
jgi:hypothetical protein